MDSQVPAFGDMTGNTPPDGQAAVLTDLPDKCLIKIFQMIPLQNLDSIIELSPKWDELVQAHIPVEVHLTDIGFRIGLHYFIGHLDLAKYRIKICHSRVLDEPLPDLKFPEDIKFLEFATNTEPATFISLTSNAINLEELHFGLNSLTDHILSSFELNLPKLKVLHLADSLIHLKHRQDCSILPKNIIGFLRKLYPSLQTLILSTSASKKQSIEYTREIFLFIQNHNATLRQLKTNLRSPAAEYCQRSDLKTSDIIELPHPEEYFDLEKMAALKLEELELSFGQNRFIGLEQWAWILNNQIGLVHLTLGMDTPMKPSFYVTPINQSASTLVSVQIGIEIFNKYSDFRESFDCSVFENCCNLKMLVLLGVSEVRSPQPELLNMDSLPVGLVGLALEDIFLESRQGMEIMRKILKSGSDLKRLSLRNVGTEGEYGFTLCMIDTLISAQGLTELIVKGVNGDEMRLHEYDHLVKLGVKAPLAECNVHAVYYPKFMGYRNPQNVPQEEEDMEQMKLNYT